ncbi:unnamed protein product [Acanthoscelides obtectus]|uniref:Uncharacterized protein n=1 Tax=Acanthoscelides obtectus TaxID=200917 RepID=A0A9P0MAW7_ACAOB|nr:unnamed protein product [Acanthoscelides obtectus]CAK1667978.1 hypothetical protein AOBTE_LOCUS26156 [Acanthoscelides obtectus]
MVLAFVIDDTVNKMTEERKYHSEAETFLLCSPTGEYKKNLANHKNR